MGATGEFRQHWRPLAAAFLGMGSALSLNSFILSTFAPYLIEEFGWTRSEWAMTGVVAGLLIVCLPIVGRLTDLFGARPVAAAGALTFPMFLVAIAMMNGSIGVYLVIYIAQMVLGSATTATVYSRVVAEAFTVRRGLALAIAGSSPALVGALGSPLITAFVQDHGWRAGYLAVAFYCAVCAVATLWLMPGRKPVASAPLATRAAAKPSGGVYRRILRMPVFWMMLVACFLVNLPFTLALSQIKLVTLEQGISDAAAAIMISAFAIGSLIGRFIAGFALDMLPGHVVAAVGFGLPFVGLLLLASPYDAMWVVGFAILLLGLSFGSEGDVIPFLITHYFDMAVFSTVMGLLSAAIGLAMALGNVAVGVSLTATGNFDAYLMIAAGGSFLGSAIFLLLGLPYFRTTPYPASP